MTVDELIAVLTEFSKQGHGDLHVFKWDSVGLDGEDINGAEIGQVEAYGTGKTLGTLNLTG
jgi:hypothetical protein